MGIIHHHPILLIALLGIFFSLCGTLRVDYLIEAAISAVVSVGLSLLSATLFKPKAPNEIVSFPPNQITRGAYLPFVIGRRVVGPSIGFVGNRRSHAAPHAGGSEITPQPSTGEIYSEAGWHQLCHGPTRVIRRMWAGALVVSQFDYDGTTIADGTSHTLLSYGPADQDKFAMFYGRDPNVNPDYQPIYPYLTGSTDIPSCYPGLTYIMWHRKNLGYAPQWPLMKYEVENHPDDIMAAAGLEDIFTPNGIPIWFNETNPSDTYVIDTSTIVNTVWLNGQQNIPAGTYTITYLYGAMKQNSSANWSAYSYQPTVEWFNMQVVNTDSSVHTSLPWRSVGTNTFATQQEVETANAGASITVDWPGGPMGFRVLDLYHRPNMVPGSPSPTYSVQLSSGGDSPIYIGEVSVQGGSPGSGDMGANPAVVLWIMLCAGFPYGCGISTSCIDQTALLAMATQLAAERLVVNVIVEQGRDASDAIASLMADVGFLMPQVGGLLTPYLIRTETSVPEITTAVRIGVNPEQVRVTAPIVATRITFQLNDCLNNYAVSDLTLDNDAIAGTGNRPKAQTIKLENVVSRTVAQQIAYRRAVEIYSTPHTVPSFQTTRETRNPAFHPGRSFIMDGSQYRVTSWKPEMNGTTCEIGAVLDQYGDTSVTFDPDGGGDSLVVPPADPPMPDLFFSPYIIPRSEWPAINTPVFAVPRVRANDAVSGAAIWISNTSSGTYNQIGTQDQASAGGLLLSDMNNSAGVLVTGPAISPYTDNDDITSVPDLTGDDVDYNNGALTVLIDSEIMLLESVTANDDGSYTLNNVTRGAFNTTVINHSAGTPVVIVQYADVTPNSSPLLAALSPAGGTLWIKTQPTDGNTWVDLSIVTPEPLGVPENLLATIQITAPYGNQIATLGRPLVISWITSNLIGTLDIAWSEDGVTWNPIATGVADTGSYSWIVNAPASTTAQIRVSSDPSPLVYATSYPFIIGGVTVTPDVMSDTPMAFNGPSGTNWPAGVYIVSYVNGSVNYNTGAGAYFTVNGPTSIQEYVVTYNGSSGAVSVPGPGLYAVFSTTAPVEAVNAGQQISIIHFGGEMTVACADSYYPDNAAGTPATTFGLSQ